jgi:hypothetical protein
LDSGVFKVKNAVIDATTSNVSDRSICELTVFLKMRIEISAKMDVMFRVLTDLTNASLLIFLEISFLAEICPTTPAQIPIVTVQIC